MHKSGCVITTTGIDRITGAGTYKSIPVYSHDNEWYVKKEDFDLLINLNADLCYMTVNKDGLCYKVGMFKFKKESRKRGKLIARLQKKLHDCYNTIDQLARLCAILLNDNDNLNLCMVKAEIPTEILLKIRSYGRGE